MRSDTTAGERELSPTSRIRPSVKKFLFRKWLLRKEGDEAVGAKCTVVQTYPLFIVCGIWIIACQDVPTLLNTQEGRQRTPLF
jgi:hypothetical protein